MKAKFYRMNRWFFCHKGTGVTEKVMAYKHEYGIVNLQSNLTIEPGEEGTEEITEVQFNRIKKLVLARLLKK